LTKHEPTKRDKNLRLFVAVELPDDVKAGLGAAIDLLRAAAAVRTADHTLLPHAHPCSHSLERTCVG